MMRHRLKCVSRNEIAQVMKVPRVTIFFWIIKICCTTVGETLADYLTNHVNWHLPTVSSDMSSLVNISAISDWNMTNTTDSENSDDTTDPLNEAVTVGVFGGILMTILIVQFLLSKYHAVVYWLAVVFMSIEGTLVTDNLTDNLGVELWKTTLIFASALLATFGAWYWFERTLDIHSIFTLRRELWYWLTILFTFALGTSFGDLISQYLSDADLALSGFAAAVLVFAGWIAAIAAARCAGLLPPVPAFWCAYVMTRPLGASIGDLLSQDRGAGGLGLGTSTTSVMLMAIIVAATLYLAWSGVDLIPRDADTGAGAGAAGSSEVPLDKGAELAVVVDGSDDSDEAAAAGKAHAAGEPALRAETRRPTSEEDRPRLGESEGGRVAWTAAASLLPSHGEHHRRRW